MKKKVLIIGASGFLGTRICYEALQRKIPIAGTYHAQDNIQLAECSYYQLDLVDQPRIKEIFSTVKPDVVILCAGSRDIGYCEQNYERAYAVHVTGTRNVIRACVSLNTRMVYVSTDAVFSGEKKIYTEQDRPKSINVYGKVKLLAEDSVLQSNIDAVIIRSSLLFGWSYKGQGINTVEYTIRRLRQGQTVTLPDTLYNTPIHVGAAAKLLIQTSLSSIRGIYNLAGKTIISRFELGLQAAKRFNLEQSLIVPTLVTSGLRPVNSCLCVSKIEKYFHIDLDDIHQGLTRMLHEPEILPGFSNGRHSNNDTLPNVTY
jgi:dTDP-4-dehydrorhamnose reductase